jgi:hypothetical protein
VEVVEVRMSDKLICRVWRSFPKGGASLNVLMALAERCNEGGSCWLPLSRLAKLARLSPSTTFAAVNALRKDRWIVTSRMMGQGGMNVYQLNVPLLIRSAREGLGLEEDEVTRASRKAREQSVRRAERAALRRQRNPIPQPRTATNSSAAGEEESKRAPAH